MNAEKTDGARLTRPSDRGSASYAVVPMERAHVPEVLAIERESYTNPWPKDAFEHEIERNPLSSPRVALTLTGSETDRVAAYCVTWVVLDILHVQNIAVHPDHRRSGLGTHLLHTAFEDATALDSVVRLVQLEVRRSNLAALNLYESLGFRVVGERLGYYSRPNEDAMLLEMELALRPACT